MTARIIPFPLRLAPQGKVLGPPAKVIPMRAPGSKDAVRCAWELYEQACKIDEDPARYDEAGALYLEALTLDPELALARVNLGNIFFKKGQEQAAIHCYELAMELDAWQPEANYNMGYILLERGDAKGAILWMLKAAQRDYRFADAHFNLGVAYEQVGERALAQQSYRRYLEIEWTGPWADMARAYLRDPPPKRGRKK